MRAVRYALLADVHASLPALEATLDAASAAGAERVVCAGDLVGYHADPEACVGSAPSRGGRVRGRQPRSGRRRDRGPRGLFGREARRVAILWTRARLSAGCRAFLAGLPLARVVDGRFLLVHGALHPAPNADLHLSTAARVARSLEALREGPWGVRLAVFGHTHRAVVHASIARGNPVLLVPLRERALPPLSPGSVGQPRGRRSARFLRPARRRGRLGLRPLPARRARGPEGRVRLRVAAERALDGAGFLERLLWLRARAGRRDLVVLSYHRPATSAGELDPGLVDVSPASWPSSSRSSGRAPR